MSQYARIENGEVVEIRNINDMPAHKAHLWRPVVEEGAGPQRAVIVEEDQVRIVFSEPPAYVPRIISDRQFFQQLAHAGVITAEEALAAVGPGQIPAAMAALVAMLPEADQFPAQMLLTGATQFDRQHELVWSFAAAFGWNTAELDAFWTAAAQL